MSDLQIPAEMEYLVLPAEHGGSLKFWGRYIDNVENDREGTPRWAELQVYYYVDTNPAHDGKLPESDPDREMYGRRGYLLYTKGHSVLYHEAYSPCNFGVTVKVRDFTTRSEDTDILRPCPECNPGDWRTADPDDEFDLEITWYRFIKCQTADIFIEKLRKEARCKACWHRPHPGSACTNCRCTKFTPADRPLTIPGSKLVDQLRGRDPDIARAAARLGTEL